MENFTRFRTALNGFNRVDVCNYIESSAQEHQKVIQSLRGELKQLQEEKDRMAREIILLRADMADYEELSAREASRSLEAQAFAQERSQTMSQVRDLCRQTEQFWTRARAMLEQTESAQAQTARQAAAWTTRLSDLVDQLQVEAVAPGAALVRDLEGQAAANSERQNAD